MRRDDVGSPFPGRNPDLDPLSEEIVPEAGDMRISDDAAVFDLRIDERDRAEARAALADIVAVDPDPVADLKEARVTLRHAQA